MTVVLLVLGIILLVTIVLAAILIPLILRGKRSSREYWTAFDEAAVARGEQIVLPVQPGMYRGGTGTFSQVRGNGRIVLSSQRLLFRKATGPVIEVPTAQIVGVRRSKGYNGAIVGTHEHLIVALADGTEVAFFVPDTDQWERELERLIG